MSKRVACKYCGFEAPVERFDKKSNTFVCKNDVTCFERLVRFRRAVRAAIAASKGKK